MKSERAGSRLSPVLAADCRTTWTLQTTHATPGCWPWTGLSTAALCPVVVIYLLMKWGEGGAGCSGVASHYILRHVLLLSLTDGTSSRVRDRVLTRSVCMLNSQSLVFYLNLALTRHYLYITIIIAVHRPSCHHLCVTVTIVVHRSICHNLCITVTIAVHRSICHHLCITVTIAVHR